MEVVAIGAGRRGQDIHIQQNKHSSCSEQMGYAAHTESETASYLDEVWKMARLWLV